MRIVDTNNTVIYEGDNVEYIRNLLLSDPEDVTEEDEVKYGDILKSAEWYGTLYIQRDIKFEGIDYWNRPVYKIVGSNVRVGSVDTLFPDKDISPNNTTEEINNYFKDNLDELVMFGCSFDKGDDPLGYRIKDYIKLNII